MSNTTKKAASNKGEHDVTVDGKVLILRTCAPDGASYGDFKWPLTVGAIVEAPDWSPEPVCGGGLHGLAWGRGDWSLMRTEDDVVYLVLEADHADIVDIENKVKCRRCKIVFVGNGLAPGMALALAYIEANRPKDRRAKGVNHSTKDSGRASASGYYGRASASGKQSIAATLRNNGRAMAGVGGCIVVAWHDGKRPRVCVGYVGEDGIEAGKWYMVTNGKLAEVK